MRIKAIEDEITEKKIMMKDVILYMSKRAEMTFSKLALNRVKISLYDVVKTTGELKDVFRFTYNGRRYDRQLPGVLRQHGICGRSQQHPSDQSDDPRQMRP